MKKLTRIDTKNQFPIKVIQFGEGNFLRAFVDWMVDVLNEKSDFAGSIAIVQPLPMGMVDMMKNQDGLYHLIRQGIEAGETIDEARLITCVSKLVDPFKDIDAYYELAETASVELVFSNTTEAGIVFNSEDMPQGKTLAATFPGKLTQLLYHRFNHFKGDNSKGLSIVPCELIEQNGSKLKDCVLKYIDLWNLGSDFKNWINNSCAFANTLVDRIVPGYPKDEIESIKARIGYDDQLVVKSESFHLFVIEAPVSVQKAFPAHKYGLNVKYVSDITPYRTQKVRILNGAHTSMVPIGLLYGLETVSETINDEQTGKLISEIIFDEIVATIQIPGEDPKDFADQVISRFQNPFIRHELMSISLNSISKFKVRVLPTILDYKKIKGTLPNRLTFSLACMIHLYLNESITLKDDQYNLDFFKSIKNEEADALIKSVLSNTTFWDQDLTQIEGMTAIVTSHFKSIASEQMKNVLQNI
jgi:tagaturonate reductase